MDYEQKYKEALKRAQTILKLTDNPKEANGYVYTIFPELKESEDERIRKELIQYFEKVELHYMNREEILSWLENQGMQEPAWSEED